MAETEIPVNIVLRRYMCDECGGEMSTTGQMLPVKPPIYVHACPNGHMFKSRKQYPYTAYTEECEG